MEELRKIETGMVPVYETSTEMEKMLEECKSDKQG